MLCFEYVSILKLSADLTFYIYRVSLLLETEVSDVIPKLQWRTIGGVNVGELNGVLAEPWVARTREQMDEFLEEHPTNGLLFNLRELEKVDHPGAEVILETVRRPAKGAILGHNLSVYFIAEHMKPQEKIPIFEKEREAIRYFGRELASDGGEKAREKRRFARISTALAGEFEVRDLAEPFLFELVVTNLSEGGLYGVFLDSETEELGRRMLDPFNLKMLEVRLELPEGEKVELEGKLLRMEGERLEDLGVGIEFYNVKPEEENRIHEFLKREGAGEETEE